MMGVTNWRQEEEELQVLCSNTNNLSLQLIIKYYIAEVPY